HQPAPRLCDDARANDRRSPAIPPPASPDPAPPELFAAVVDGATDGIVVCAIEDEHRVIFANRAFGTLVGQPSEAVVGRPAAELFATLFDDAFVARMQRALTDGAAVAEETTLRRADGTTCPVAIECSILEVWDRRWGVARYQDLSARAASAEALQRSE